MGENNLERNDAIFNPLNFPIIFSIPERLVEPGAWVEHIPFAMFLISILRPKLFVELGTHSGNSYCAFCQAVKETDSDTRCYAVDSWQGDAHAGYYGEEVLYDLRKHHDPRYGKFSSLIQSTFDNAVHKFGDNSIDLLHIDGLHTYDAVKHDFEKWLPKVSDRGVVVFHDIVVRDQDFGVWKLWDELKINYPFFEFLYGHGLGILVVGSNYPPILNVLKSLEQNTALRDFFFQFGIRLQNELTLRGLITQATERDQTVQTLTAQVTERDQIVQTLTARVEEREQEILIYALSKSWRFMRPFRKITQFLKVKKNA